MLKEVSLKYMGFIVGFIGAFLGIIAGIVIIILIIYLIIRNAVGTTGVKEIMHAVKTTKSIEQQEYIRTKNLIGMTTLLEPLIMKDFNDFNKDFLYSKVENNLRKIFNAIENKLDNEIKNDKDLIYIYPSIIEKIQDIKNDNIDIKYDDVVFHAHAIKEYEKSCGKATIAISSALEYYYSNTGDKRIEKRFKGLKKQTRYTTKFVYIYDETKFESNQTVLTRSCPNCGAPLTKLGAENCLYCGTSIEYINLKRWYMVSYKEDFK